MGRLQTARLENFIRRWGSMKGSGSVLSETLGDVFPTLGLEILPPELMLLAGKRMWGMQTVVTGGVAQNGAVQLVNPVDSGVLVVCTEFGFESSTSQVFFWGFVNALFAGIGVASRPADSRVLGPFTGPERIEASTNAITEFAGSRRARTSITEIVRLPIGIAVLAPGTQFTVVGSTNNTTIRISFAGYTRVAEPSELSF